jgi:sec-independent protein translocase protein TatC
VMLNLVGVLSARMLQKSQRISIFLLFVFAAIACPTADPISMCALAVPLVLLFEAAVLFAVVHDSRQARRQADREAAQRIEDGIASSVMPAEPLR